MRTKRWTLAATLLVVALLLASLVAPMASAAKKKPKAPKPTKVAICHLENKASNKYHKIVVAESAVPAHLAHGDVLVADAASRNLDENCQCLADSDGDGTPDATDGCPDDPSKTEPGVCGCGVSETDTDLDLTPDCVDGCPEDPAKIEPGVCGCGVAETDTDQDLTPDCVDQCPADPGKIAPGACGCGIPDTDANNNGTADCLETP